MDRVHINYYEAARKILNGTPVKNLEEIRDLSNEKLLKVNPLTEKECFKYSAGKLITTYVIDAENKILRGIDPKEAYSDFFSKRDKLIELVKKEVEYYLKK